MVAVPAGMPSTLDRYSHAVSTVHTKAMARLDAILGRGNRASTKGL
jgi:hypothetical protein